MNIVINHDAVRVVMPPNNNKDNWVKYSSGDKQFKVPFIMYADFESILKPLESKVLILKRLMSMYHVVWCL